MAKKWTLLKLEFPGVLEVVPEVSALDSFTDLSVLALYLHNEKSLTSWIGKNAPERLKNIIANMRVKMKDKYPQYTVLRYLTVEQGHETDKFFAVLGFSRLDLYNQLENMEAKRMDIYDKVEKLKLESSNFLMVGQFEKAIEVAEEIIPIVEQLEDSFKIQEEQEYIQEIREKIERRKKVSGVKNEFSKLKQEYNAKFTGGDPYTAHRMLEEFRAAHKEMMDEPDLGEAKNFVKAQSIAWGEFLGEQKQLRSQIGALEAEYKEQVGAYHFKIAEAKLSEIKDLIPKLYDEGAKEEWEEKEADLKEKWRLYDLITSAQETMKQSATLGGEFKFSDAIQAVEEVLARVESEELPELKKQLKAKQSELTRAQGDYGAIIQKLEELESAVEENKAKGKKRVAVSNCHAIINLAPKVGREELVSKYQGVKEGLLSIIESEKRAGEEEQKALAVKAQEIQEMVKSNEGVLPLVDDYNVEDLIGTLSSDVDEILEQISGVLDDHRVEVKTEVTNKAVLTSASGEVVELDTKMEVEADVPDPSGAGEAMETKPVKYSVRSGLSNPFDEVLEEAILTDLIPYNFEISEVQLNGEAPGEKPEESLTKDGIELIWTLKNIPPRENVEIKYDLRRRVSRTVVIIQKNDMRIVRTHSNLEESDLEGLYDAKIPFNPSGQQIDNLVIEDIIPLYYMTSIREPLAPPASKTPAQSGELVKWIVEQVPQETRLYHYKLLEIYKFEALKIEAADLVSDASAILAEGDIPAALGKYQQIVHLLEEYLK